MMTDLTDLTDEIEYKRHVPDEKSRAQVEEMVGMGLTQEQISRVMLISEDTLRKYYDYELATGEAVKNNEVAKNLFSIATGQGQGAVTAAIFWLKTRARWKEVKDINIGQGADQRPLTIEGRVVDMKQLSDDQLRYITDTITDVVNEEIDAEDE